MMPVIRVDDATFGSLKSVSTWLGTDTPALTIARLVREKMDHLGLEHDDAPQDGEDQSPALSFTRVLAASVNGRSLQKSNWSIILLEVIRAVKRTGLDGKSLSEALQINSKTYEYNDHGYSYQPDIGISVQGQSAPDAWKEARRLAEKYGIKVEVRFQWRDNNKAQHPGQTGMISAGG